MIGNVAYVAIVLILLGLVGMSLGLLISSTAPSGMSKNTFLRFEGNMIKLFGHLKLGACDFGSLKGEHETKKEIAN